MLDGLRARVLRAPLAEAFDAAGHRVVLLHDGEACFASLLDAIASAEHEILVEMYWFGSDTTGRRFAAALSERAHAGVKVGVLYDAVGSFGVEEAMFDRMRAAGCAVHEHHPVAPWRKQFRVGVVNNRDHRKIVVVDGRIGFTGGVNFADQWLSRGAGGLGWRDDMVRVEGPAARALREVFLRTWVRYARQSKLASALPPAPTFPVGEAARVRVLASGYRRERHQIRHAYLTQIRRARRYVFISNSYFVPDSIVRRALRAAVERGVDVRVLVPDSPDVPSVDLASKHTYDGLLSHGVKLLRYVPSVLHAKTAVIDDRWCTIGTFNLDHRSWLTNLEVNVSIEDERVASAMRAQFERDAAEARPLDLPTWRGRPLRDRVVERFFHAFRRVL